MKRLLFFCFLAILATASSAPAALTYGGTYYRQHLQMAITGNSSADPIYLFFNEVETILEGGGGVDSLVFTPGSEPSTASEGEVYYDATGDVLKFRNASAWVTLASSGASTLDEAYDAGSGITVDGSAITLTVTDAANNSALLIDNNEATNNNDGMTIQQSGSGDALSIEPQEADSGGLNIVAVASGTVPLAILDGSTNNIDLADNKGQLLIQCDDPYIHAGAAGLVILDTSTPITAAEGFLARFVHAGTARTNSSAVEIEVPATQPALAMNGILAVNGQDAAGAALVQIANVAASGNADGVTITSTGSGDALQITVGEADGVAQRNIAAASQTTSLAVFDAATSNWDGADNIGMVHIVADDPVVHTGASLLQVIQSGQPIAASEGHLARFVSSGTARTDAYAVEIETTNTTPALYMNNQMTISAADSAGTLFDITAIDTTGNSDTVTIAHSGTGAALQITSSEADTQLIELISAANQTTWLQVVDGAAGNWIGADNVGMLTLKADTALTHVGASLLNVQSSAQPKAASEGFLARFVDTGTARTDAYAVEIETTNTTPALHLNNQLTIAGADSAGVLFDITGIDTTGNTDTMQIAHSGTGDALQITCSEADSVGLNLVACAAQTTSLAKIDAATNNWSGADNIGMLHINSDAALAHAGASLLQVVHATAQPITAGEGFLARFVSTGTARTNAHAVEIEVPATQPALASNGIVTITGQDSAGAALVQITGNDGTGNDDTVTINTEGTGSGLKITCDDADSVGLEALSAASQTTSLAVFDGATGNWIGADNVGMVHINGDTAGAHAGASLLQIVNTAQPIAAAEGFLARFVDTGTARPGAYAVEIEVTDTTGGLKVDGHSTFTKGVQASSQALTATADGLTTGITPIGASFCTVTSDNADKVVTLPATVVGNIIYYYCAANGFELETPAASDDTINTVDCDGTNQLACSALSLYKAVCVADGVWIVTGEGADGADPGTLTPDAD